MCKADLFKGQRIRIIEMEDPYPLPPGTAGTATGVDAIGDYEIKWDNGSKLKLITQIDK